MGVKTFNCSLICISLVNNAEHLFMHLLAIYVSVNVYSSILPNFCLFVTEL